MILAGSTLFIECVESCFWASTCEKTCTCFFIYRTEYFISCTL